MHASSSAAVLVPSRRFTWRGCTNGPCFHWLVAVAGLTSCRPTLQTSARTPRSYLGVQSLSCRQTFALLGWSPVRSNKGLQRAGPVSLPEDAGDGGRGAGTATST